MRNKTKVKNHVFNEEEILKKDNYDYAFIYLTLLLTLVIVTFFFSDGYIITKNSSFVLSGILIGIIIIFLTLSEEKYLGATFIDSYLAFKHNETKIIMLLFSFVVPIVLFIFTNYYLAEDALPLLPTQLYNICFILSIVITIYTICDIIINYILWMHSNEKYSIFIILNLIREKNITAEYSNEDEFLIKQELEKYSLEYVGKFIKIRDTYLEHAGIGYKSGSFKRANNIFDARVFFLFETISSFLKEDDEEIYLDVAENFNEFYRQQYAKIRDSENNIKEDVKLTYKYFISPSSRGINYSKDATPTDFECMLVTDYIANMDIGGNETYFLKKVLNKFVINRTQEIYVRNFSSYVLIELFNCYTIHDDRKKNLKMNCMDIVVKSFSSLIYSYYEEKKIKNFIVTWELKNMSYSNTLNYILHILNDENKIIECIKLIKEIEKKSFYSKKIGEIENENIVDYICKKMCKEFEKKLYELCKNKINDIFLRNENKVRREISKLIENNLDLLNHVLIKEEFLDNINEDFAKEIAVHLLENGNNHFLASYIYEATGGKINEYHKEEFKEYVDLKYNSINYHELIEKLNEKEIKILLQDIDNGYMSFRGATYSVWYVFEKYIFIYADKYQENIIEVFNGNKYLIITLINYLYFNEMKIKFNLEKYLDILTETSGFYDTCNYEIISEYFEKISEIEIEEQSLYNLVENHEMDVSYLIDKVKINSELVGNFIPFRIDCSFCILNNYRALFRFINKNNDQISLELFKKLYNMLEFTNFNESNNAKLLETKEYCTLKENIKNYAIKNNFVNIK